MVKKILYFDSISLLLFVVVLIVFLWLSTLNVLRGPSSADDAWIALSAKNITVGNGYSTSVSSSEFVHYDPFISTGPTLVLPVALLIKMFGPLSWIPGTVQLLMFIFQLGAFVAILVCRAGWPSTLAYISAVMLFLLTASANNWYFGALLGEPVALGFLLVGTAFLAVEKTGRAVSAAAICFSLAFLTKQIAAIAVVGIVLSWIVLSIYARKSLFTIIRQFTLLVLVGLSLPLTFEVIKLSTLGFDGYLSLLKKTADSVSSHGYRLGNVIDRWNMFLNIIDQFYIPLALATWLAIGSVVLFVLFVNRYRECYEATRLFIFICAGSIVYLGYILCLSTLRPRYFWIGITIALAAPTIPLLFVGIKWRFAGIFLLLACTISLGLYRPLLELHGHLITSTVAKERSTVVQILNDQPAMPYAAQHWSSIYDVVYLRDLEGRWVFGPDVNDLRGRDFIGIINHPFTDKSSPFFINVNATCELLTPDAKRIKAYYCGSNFWESYSQ